MSCRILLVSVAAPMLMLAMINTSLAQAQTPLVQIVGKMISYSMICDQTTGFAWSTVPVPPGEGFSGSATIVNDSAVALNETFAVTLNNLADATPEAAATNTYRISNDDKSAMIQLSAPAYADTSPTPRVQFDLAASSGAEARASAVLAVSLSAPAILPVMVNYTTADGTAKAANGDYAPTSGTLTFDPGVTRQTIAVPIAGDGMWSRTRPSRWRCRTRSTPFLGKPRTPTRS
jgi:hypothetical protein